MSYETSSYNELSHDRIVQDKGYNPVVSALSDEQLEAEMNRRRLANALAEIERLKAQNAQLIKEKDNAIAEKENAIAEKNRYKAQAEYAQNLVTSIAISSNSSPKDMKDTCQRINDFFDNGKVSTKKKKDKEQYTYTKETFDLRVEVADVKNKTLIKAFKDCVRYGFIPKDTTQKNFIDIFSGQVTDATIKWKGKPCELAYLMREIKKKKAIIIPSAGIWNVTKSHIKDEYGKDITVDLASQHAPTNKEVLANLNDIIATFDLGY